MSIPDPVRDRIQRAATELTPAERKLSAELLRDYPVAGLQSITKLADAAGISTPTVVRLARKLGFDGFAEMQAALRTEASGQINRPAPAPDGWLKAGAISATFGTFAEAVHRNLADTIARLEPAGFEAIVDLLADWDRRILLMGGRLTRANADYFATLLQIIRPGVGSMPEAASLWPQALVDVDAGTVLVIFDIRRYDPQLAKVADRARARGATLVLFTDNWGSPIARVADHVVNAAVEAPSSWDSTLGLSLVIEAMVAEVQARRPDESQARIDALEDLHRAGR